jgi:uncharacterized membrane protein YccC
MTETPEVPGERAGSRPPIPGIIDWFFARDFSNPDIGRALRCMLSFMAPLAVGLSGRLPVEMIFTAIAAQNVAIVDVRGAYGLRLSLLLSMSGILAAASALGAIAAPSLAACLAAAVIVALGAGFWRHLSSDYGPSLAISASLLCFIAMAEKGGTDVALRHAAAALAGGCWGAALQVALWPVRPQHPLRQAVGESWLAVARVCVVNADRAAETELRSALDKAYAILGGARARRNRLVVGRLEELNSVGARLAQRVSAFQHAYEEFSSGPPNAGVQSAAETTFSVLGNLSRTIALAVVSRQPGHLAAAEVRLRRLRHLFGVLQRQISAQGDPARWAALGSTAGQIASYLAEIGEALRKTIDRAADRGAFSMELSDLAHLKLRPLVAALNLSRRVDPALVRFTARIVVITLSAVWAMKFFNLRHGYWLPMTTMIVLQPDFGSTRKKAFERLVGTLAGSIVASLVLWLNLPFQVLMAATAVTAFCFGYYLRRNYAIAVVFITLFVVVLTESLGPATLELTIERFGDTLAGGLLALLAAFVFWPVWERARFRPILARALRANAAYLRIVGARLAEGLRYDMKVVRAKRAAESASAAVFSSLLRMSGDPENFRDRMNELAAVANGNQRVTRALNLLVLQAGPDAPAIDAREIADQRARALEAIASSFEGPTPQAEAFTRARHALEWRPERAPARVLPGSGAIALAQLARASAEIEAMLLEAEELAEEPAR